MQDLPRHKIGFYSFVGVAVTAVVVLSVML